MRIFLALPLITMTVACAPAQTPNTVKVLVHASGTQALSAEQIRVENNGVLCPVLSVRHVGTTDGAPLEVAVLMDDDSRFDVRRLQPAFHEAVAKLAAPRVAVGVGFMRQDKVSFPIGFSTNRERVLQTVETQDAALRLVAFPDIVLSNIARSWPVHPTAARVILLITTAVADQIQPNGLSFREKQAETAKADAQRANIPVYAIFSGQVVSPTGGNGYYFLDDLTGATGGILLNGIDSWHEGSAAKTLIQQFQADMAESYMVEFATAGKPGISKLRITSQVPGVKLQAQKAIVQ